MSKRNSSSFNKQLSRKIWKSFTASVSLRNSTLIGECQWSILRSISGTKKILTSSITKPTPVDHMKKDLPILQGEMIWAAQPIPAFFTFLLTMMMGVLITLQVILWSFKIWEKRPLDRDSRWIKRECIKKPMEKMRKSIKFKKRFKISLGIFLIKTTFAQIRISNKQDS